MKTIYAINGSPRKKGNTAQLLDQALAGAKASFSGEEITAERIDLYDLHYTGCRSCFACKRKGGASYGKCAVRDDLHSLLEKLLNSNGVIIGSPVYFQNISGQLHALYERLLFPYTVYSTDRSSIPQRSIPFGFVYTMNVTEAWFNQSQCPAFLRLWESLVGRNFGYAGHCLAFNTYQFQDYGQYVSDLFSEPDKAAYRKAYWPQDCRAAYELGGKVAALACGGD